MRSTSWCITRITPPHNLRHNLYPLSVWVRTPIWLGNERQKINPCSPLIFSFYSPILVAMRTLPFPKCCVVCCKKCGHDVLSGTDGFPASSIFVVCSMCGEKRRYLPSEVIHGRPHLVVRRKRAPVAAQFGSLSSARVAVGRGR
jgi:hypothetical protein